VVKGLIEKLFLNEAKLLKAFFFHKTSSSEVAEDLCQELMTRLISSGRIQHADNPRLYMFKAAANLVKDHYRKKAAELQILDHVKHSPDTKHDPLTAERVLEARQKFEILETALAELPLRSREIFKMVRVDGKKQADVAKKLGVSLRTVENNLRTALLHCQRKLQEKELEK